MININYKKNIIVGEQKIIDLYENAGWSNYTKNPEVLMKAIEHSLIVITAWDKDSLVGLIRAVGDGYTILYIQDILVHSEYRRQGIGKHLMVTVLNEYSRVRQKVLMTDNQEDTVAFYQSLGFVPTETYQGIAFVQYYFE